MPKKPTEIIGYHGHPTYPFSLSLEGIIAQQLYDGRKEADQRHQQNLAALEKLILSKPSQTHGSQSFQEALYAIQRLHQSQQDTTAAVRELGGLTAQGFTQIHEDLGDIKGPEAPIGSLREIAASDERLNEIFSAHQNGILNQAAGRQLANLWQEWLECGEHELVDKIIQAPAFQEKKEQVSSDSINYTLVEAGLRFMQYPSGMLYDPSATEKLAHFRKFVLNELDDCFKKADSKDPESVKNFGKIVNNIRAYLIQWINKAEALLKRYKESSNKPITKETILGLGKSNLLSGTAKNRAVYAFPEARTDASLTTINASLLDIVRDNRQAFDQRNLLAGIGIAQVEQQAEIAKQSQIHTVQHQIGIQQRDEANQLSREANYRLGSIIDNLEALNEGVDDVTFTLREFIHLVDEGFTQLSKGLTEGVNAITAEMVLTRVAVMTELQVLEKSLQKVGVDVQTSVNRGNILLAELIDRVTHIAENTNAIRARERFQEGKECLMKATNLSDIKDAHKAFKKGIEENARSVENYFGAAICAEILEDLPEAHEYYDKAAKRSPEDQNEFASYNFEQAARISATQGNIPQAVSEAKRAVTANPQNYNARYSYARYLVLSGANEQALIVLAALIAEQESYLLQISIDPVFQKNPEKLRQELYIHLWEIRAVKSPQGLFHLMNEMGKNNDVKTFMQIFTYLFEAFPDFLLKKKIFEDPILQKMRSKIDNYIKSYLEGLIGLADVNLAYAIVGLSVQIGMNSSDVSQILRRCIMQDPNYRKGDRIKIYERLKKYAPEDPEKLWQRLQPYL